MSKLLAFVMSCVLFWSFFPYMAQADERQLTITSAPSSASVFHLLRGRYYLLGHTPLTLTKKKLDGKNRTNLFIYRFGYHEQLMPVYFEKEKFHVNLKASSFTIDSSDWNTDSSRELCGSMTVKTLNKIKDSSPAETPFLLSEHTRIYGSNDTEKGLILTGRLIEAKMIKNIKREYRHGRKDLSNRLLQHLDPYLSEYITLLKTTGCFDHVDVVLNYQDKGIGQKFEPAQVGWSAVTTYETLDNKTETLVQWGTSTELKSELAVRKRQKKLLLRYSVKN